ncbi:kinetochore protein Spc25 [Megalops cyprinoides]|uniref:kinetochore protein Spc25 n=1 Tax=Megalops cyprinoides TaxID=118141 RepID=UPI001864B162|nr:kinetochore protein Spc25 [Megalops cyprinoides]
MACIQDPDVVEHFSSKLEEIRSKLLSQAVGEMIDTEEELRQAHKQFFKSVKDTCSKKCKEDETMFETFQIYRRDLEHIRALTKEKRGSIPDTLSELEEKEIQKETMIRNINRLKEGQAKKRELIISQNKANKARLKNLNKAKQVFQDWLGLEIRKIHGEKLQFVFRNINHKDPEGAYTFILRINEEGSYEVVSCDPPLENMGLLERRLQETKNFSAFLANVRKEFSS